MHGVMRCLSIIKSCVGILAYPPQRPTNNKNHCTMHQVMLMPGVRSVVLGLPQNPGDAPQPSAPLLLVEPLGLVVDPLGGGPLGALEDGAGRVQCAAVCAGAVREHVPEQQRVTHDRFDGEPHL